MKRCRPLALAVLTLAVISGHLWVMAEWAPLRLGEGSADSRPKPIAVSFVRELAPSAPPAAPPREPRLAGLAAAPVTAAVPVPEPAASAPPPRQAPPPPLEPAVQTDAATVAQLGMPATSPGPVADAALPAGPAASAPTAFEWPPSTRLDYRLEGHFRGPVQGQARVEWLREGTRYQVHLDLTIGPSFSPLASRRISSEGEVTAQGLRPRRYDEETRALLRDTRRSSIALDADVVRLPTGRELPRPVGVQDSASQFVQLTWLFTTQPQLLQAGQVIAFPLALPRQVDVWTYDVLATERVLTPAGSVEAVHVKPRREAKAGGDLSAEVWFAPSLQYLPVRLLIRQDADTYLDLSLDRLPQQAAPGR